AAERRLDLDQRVDPDGRRRRHRRPRTKPVPHPDRHRDRGLRGRRPRAIVNNIEVVTLLTHMLEIAKSDPMFIHCAVAMVKEPDVGIFHYEVPAASDRLQRQTVAELLADLDKSDRKSTRLNSSH